MPQVRVLGKGARITGGIFCLLYGVYTWVWVLRDVAELGFGSVWQVWTGVLGPTAGALTDIPATTPDDIGLGLLQIAAAFAAFTGAWTAGGLMAVTTALTLAYRLPVLWHAGLHSESRPYYAVRGFFDDPSVDAAWAGSAWAVLFSVPLAIVLMAGLRMWTGQPARPAQGAPAPAQAAQPYGVPGWQQPPPPQVPRSYEPPLPSECPQRPVTAHALLAALYLGSLLLFSIGWTGHALLTAGGGHWLRLFTGEGIVVALLDVSPGWAWLVLIPVCGLGAGLALGRTVSARGFSLGLALALLPPALTGLWGYVDAGVFFELGGAAPVAALFSRAQLLITLAGGGTLIVLTLRPGVPAQPGPAPAPGPLPFGGPVSPPGAPAPFGAPAGVYGPPQAQPQAPALAQAQPPGYGPAPQQAPAQPHFPPQPPGPPPGAPPQAEAPGGSAAPVQPGTPTGTAPERPPETPPHTPPTAPPETRPAQDGSPGGTFGPPPAY